MGKRVVLKPIVWNDRGYRHPAGLVSNKGYPGEHGYGHEEWNANPDLMWRGWKVFHTQSKGRMVTYGATGELGIIMTTMLEGRFYAVGCACNVFLNTEDEQRQIAEDLDLLSIGAQLWELPAVRERKSSKAAFDRHWKEAHRWMQWRCPATHFHWFDEPIEILPNEIIPSPRGKPPRQAIVKMFGSYQAIRPDQARAIVGQRLPLDHPAMAWLSAEDFDEIKGTTGKATPPPGGRSAAPASAQYRRYLLENEVLVTPRHHALQKQFEKFVKKAGAKSIKSDVARVDLRFTMQSLGMVFAEIKPAEADTVRFTIRSAIGQLLDYQQKDGGDPKLLIVVGTEPSHSDDKALALRNGFGLAWPTKAGFEIIWPEDATERLALASATC